MTALVLRHFESHIVPALTQAQTKYCKLVANRNVHSGVPLPPAGYGGVGAQVAMARLMGSGPLVVGLGVVPARESLGGFACFFFSFLLFFSLLFSASFGLIGDCGVVQWMWSVCLWTFRVGLLNLKVAVLVRFFVLFLW